MAIWIPILLMIGGAALMGLGILADIKGYKLAVLGARRVGKTVLIKFLTTGTLSKEYVKTARPKKTDSRRFKLKKLDLKIEESIDSPGSEYYYSQWENITKDADIVLYLLRVDLLMKGDRETEERVKRDISHVSDWLQESEKKYPLFIIGTYCDQTVPDFTKLSKNEKVDYVDERCRMPIFRDIELRGGGAQHVRFVFGSLKSKDTTEKLVYNMLASLDASKS